MTLNKFSVSKWHSNEVVLFYGLGHGTRMNIKILCRESPIVLFCWLTVFVIFMYMYVHAGLKARRWLGRVSSCHLVGPEDWTQVIRDGEKIFPSYWPMFFGSQFFVFCFFFLRQRTSSTGWLGTRYVDHTGLDLTVNRLSSAKLKVLVITLDQNELLHCYVFYVNFYRYGGLQ